MPEIRLVLFDYTTDNVEEFSSEISTIEDKQELLKLKQIIDTIEYDYPEFYLSRGAFGVL